jgi:hypothetical protein
MGNDYNVMRITDLYCTSSSTKVGNDQSKYLTILDGDDEKVENEILCNKFNHKNKEKPRESMEPENSYYQKMITHYPAL